MPMLATPANLRMSLLTVLPTTRPSCARILPLICRRMPGGDVAHFVPQDDRQFGLAVHQGEDAPGDVDIAAGRGEGVDHRRVQHGEVVFQVRPVESGDHALADAFNVLVQGLVLVNAVLLADRLVRLLAHGDLLLFGEEHQLLLAADRIDGAGDERPGPSQNPRCDE